MQNRHTTKKVARLSVVGLGLALLAPGTGHAAFASLARSTNTAVATLTGSGSVSMSVAIKKISDNTSDTQINWTGVTLPANYVLAANYIQLDSTITASGGGIEIYTDNTAADANPRYTGVISSTTQTPAGLVDTTLTTQKLPVAWSIKANLGAPVADNPNSGGGNSFQWLFHEHRAQIAVPSQSAGAFVDGDAYVTVKNTNGIHFGQAPTEFGAAGSPNFIYTEAGFTAALTPRTYRTSTLRLEAYTQ